jgi:hypothetical protein
MSYPRRRVHCGFQVVVRLKAQEPVIADGRLPVDGIMMRLRFLGSLEVRFVRYLKLVQVLRNFEG